MFSDAAVRRPAAGLAATVVLALVLAAASLAWSPGIQQHQNADSLIHSLISTHCWTPCYWGQNRLGSLLPLITRCLHDPLRNLLVQNALSTLAGFISMSLVAVYFVRPARGIAAGLLSSAILGGLLTDRRAFDFFVGQPEYFVALVPGLLALLLLPYATTHSVNAPRIACAWVLLLTARWVNPAAAALVAALAAARWMAAAGLGDLRRPGFSALAGTLALVVSALAAAQLLASLSPAPASDFHIVAPADWPDAWAELVRRWWQSHLGPHGLGLLLVTLAGASIASSRHRPDSAATRRVLTPALAPWLVMAAYALLIGVCEHVSDNKFSARYMIPATALLVTGCANLSVTAAAQRWPLRTVTLAAGAILIAAMLVRYGLPRPARVEALFRHTWSDRAEQANAQRATHLLGRYWDVWPTVFYANLLRHRANDGAVMYGLAYRATPTVRLWAGMPGEDLRVAVIRTTNPREVNRVCREYGVPPLDPTPLAETSHVTVHAVSP
jgi:hypothetical protein